MSLYHTQVILRFCFTYYRCHWIGVIDFIAHIEEVYSDQSPSMRSLCSGETSDEVAVRKRLLNLAIFIGRYTHSDFNHQCSAHMRCAISYSSSPTA